MSFNGLLLLLIAVLSIQSSLLVSFVGTRYLLFNNYRLISHVRGVQAGFACSSSLLQESLHETHGIFPRF